MGQMLLDAVFPGFSLCFFDTTESASVKKNKRDIWILANNFIVLPIRLQAFPEKSPETFLVAQLQFQLQTKFKSAASRVTESTWKYGENSEEEHW